MQNQRHKASVAAFRNLAARIGGRKSTLRSSRALESPVDSSRGGPLGDLHPCDLPVPDGPHTHSTSFRSIHSSVRNACWVGFGIADLSGSHASNVLPAGSPDERRRIDVVAWSRPAASSASSTLRTSACSQRCALAVASASGAARRTYGRRSRRRSRSSSTGNGGGSGGLTVIAVLRSAPPGRRAPAALTRARAPGLV